MRIGHGYPETYPTRKSLIDERKVQMCTKARESLAVDNLCVPPRSWGRGQPFAQASSPAMNDDQATKAIRSAWVMVLAEHRSLVATYVEVLGMPCAPLIGRQVGWLSGQVVALAELLKLTTEDELRP